MAAPVDANAGCAACGAQPTELICSATGLLTDSVTADAGNTLSSLETRSVFALANIERGATVVVVVISVRAIWSRFHSVAGVI